MAIDLKKGTKQIRSFQETWPLSRLEKMTLKEYTNLERSTSFTYWIESVTSEAGSIWGGSAYKFLIFERQNVEKIITDPTCKTDGKYSWWVKLGEDKETVFEITRKEVLKIAKAASDGNLDETNSEWFGPAVNWKIAYLYNPEKIIPIYKREVMERTARAYGMSSDRSTPISAFHQYLLPFKSEGQHTLEFADFLWSRYKNGSIYHVLEAFIKQSKTTDLATKSYAKKYQDLNIKISFGAGIPAKIPWLAFTNEFNTVSKGIYPCYLFFKEENLLFLTYCISETEEPNTAWPEEMLKTSLQDYFEEHLDKEPYRYGSAYVYKVYEDVENLDPEVLQEDLNRLLAVYKEIEFEEEVEEEVDEIENDEETVWLIAAGIQGRFWEEWRNNGLISIGWDHLGDLIGYESRNDITTELRTQENVSAGMTNDSKACYEFAREMKIGDYVLAKKGASTILGIGRILSGYIFENRRTEHKNIRKVEWINTGVWKTEWRQVTKTLTNITVYTDYVEKMLKLTLPEVAVDGEKFTTYTFDQLFEEVFFDEVFIEDIAAILSHKKNIILQGPPGTGKTYLARRLAYAMMGAKDKTRVKMIQFHQSYAYEDFIQGFRPNDDGNFKLVDGVFYRFCSNAQEYPDRDYFFIIDEINRGNLSKIFGELMMLIEHDKRGEEFKIPLTYSPAREEFYIPKNVHIIGTMNTADRSLAMVDYALRRRFAFIELLPQLNAKFAKHLESNGVDQVKIARITSKMQALNNIIEAESDLGTGFLIGHSYFCNIPADANDQWYNRIMKNEILPLLGEYWFDKPAIVDREKTKLLS